MRPWERLIPERDRMVYQKAGFGQRQPFGKRPALLIIDVVLSFTGSKPEPVLTSIEEFRTSCGDQAWDGVLNLKTLLQAARQAQIPVVFTRGDAYLKGLCGDSAKGMTLGDIQRAHSTDIHPSIAPLPNEFVLKKTKASAFFATPLATYLHSLGVDCLIVGGTSTSGCVRASVVDAYSCGYTVFLVEECCFDRSEISHAVNLFDMNGKYADVVTLEEALDLLRSLREAGKTP